MPRLFNFYRFLLAFVILVNISYAYKKYADPIKLGNPDPDGTYAFDMEITRKLTMSFHNDNVYQHGTPVDFNPYTMQWSKRDPEQTIDCFASYNMNINTDPNDAHAMEDVLTYDGLHKRVLASNGVSPGLPIVVSYNSSVLLRVHNNVLMNTLSVHVHGIDKHGMWFMDGVSYVQQCPIHSTNYFEYRFIADNKGTHWLHGHMQTDRGDGLYGSFIVVDPNDRSVPVDNSGKREVPSREYVLMLADWSTQWSTDAWENLDDKTMKWMYGFDNFTQCWQPTRTIDGGNVGGAVPISSILFNDKGWFSQDDQLNRPHNLPLERFLINEKESVLFRIINGGVAQELFFFIEDHQMTIVAADGDEVVPYSIDKLIIFPGERYDILIHGLAKPTKKVYYMRAETMQYWNWNWTVSPTTYGFGFLEYENQNLTIDTTPPSIMDPNCNNTHPCMAFNCPFDTYPFKNITCTRYDVLQFPKPEEIDPEILQDTAFNAGFEEHFINMHYDSHMDDYMFEFPKGMPYYHSDNLDLIAKNCSTIDCPPDAVKYDRRCRCFYHKKHKLENIVQLVIYNMGNGGGLGTGYAHPIHIHGTHFYVMKVGWPTYNASGFINQMNPDIGCGSDAIDCNYKGWKDPSWANGAVKGMNTKNPSRRDTITLPVGGYIMIRFRASNPGWWFAHCHLELHLMGGTGWAFKVGDDDQIYMPPDNFPKDCGVFKLDKLPDLKLPTPAPPNPGSTTTVIPQSSMSSTGTQQPPSSTTKSTGQLTKLGTIISNLTLLFVILQRYAFM